MLVRQSQFAAQALAMECDSDRFFAPWSESEVEIIKDGYDLDVEASFLFRFADCCLCRAFTRIDSSGHAFPGTGGVVLPVRAFEEQDVALIFDEGDDDNGKARLFGQA